MEAIFTAPSTAKTYILDIKLIYDKFFYYNLWVTCIK